MVQGLANVLRMYCLGLLDEIESPSTGHGVGKRFLRQIFDTQEELSNAATKEFISLNIYYKVY